jgi:carboxylesterase type B
LGSLRWKPPQPAKKWNGVRPDAKLPVLVFFHGGSNTQGYSQMVPLGPPLSKYGVVVVSANYRIGPFGFLAHPLLTAESEHHSSGNYGLLDQIQALKWTQFAKTGSPNSSNSPRWLAYGENPNHAFELGRRIGLRPINPRVPRVAEVMERIVKNTDVATRSAQK